MRRSDLAISRVVDIDTDDDSESGGVSADEEPQYACCILWTPIHPITWVLPFVGHMGVCDSSGRLHDWGGGPISGCKPSHMMFGTPARYLRLKPRDVAAWDAAIAQADDEYSGYIHCMVLGSDCHSHVARVLDISSYTHYRCLLHNKVCLAATVFFFGRHSGWTGFVSTWLGFALFVLIFGFSRALRSA